MADGIEFHIEGGPEWDRVVAALTEVAATLPTKIHNKVTDSVDPWIAQAKTNVITTPVKGVTRSTGLRREVANSVSKDVTGTTDRFEVTVTSSLPPGQGEENEAAIPPGMESEVGWRHPVFGHMNRWVQQVPLRHHWFGQAFENHQDEVSRDIQHELDDARDFISRAGE